MSYGDHGMSLQRFAAMTHDERIAWLISYEHWGNCIGYNEGQVCCLEALVVRTEEERQRYSELWEAANPPSK